MGLVDGVGWRGGCLLCSLPGPSLPSCCPPSPRIFIYICTYIYSDLCRYFFIYVSLRVLEQALSGEVHLFRHTWKHYISQHASNKLCRPPCALYSQIGNSHIPQPNLWTTTRSCCYRDRRCACGIRLFRGIIFHVGAEPKKFRPIGVEPKC